jgi:hypothetical protein
MRVHARTKSPREPKPAKHREPRLPTGQDINGKKIDGLRYEKVQGDLFVGGAAADDVGQGRIGDCYFLASLAAVAKTHPELIKRAVHENKDGTFTVTFKDKSQSVPITVDADFPEGARGQAFGRGLDVNARGPELWPAIFEKAFAQWKGGYQKLNQGGFADEVLPTLTGKATRRKWPPQMSAQKLWDTLSAAAKAGEPMVTGTPSASELKRRTGRADMAGLLDGHDYAILGCHEKDGARTVELYTPLAPADCGLPGKERTLTLSLEDYRRLFDDLVIGSR